MSRGYSHTTQPNTWETQNYRRGGGRTVTFAPPQAYVTTTETVVEKVRTRPIIMDYDVSQLDDRSRTAATHWQQQRRPASPEDPRRHDDANYGNGHRDRHDGYVSSWDNNNNYPNRYDHPVEVERIRPPATTGFWQPRPSTQGAPLTSATNDINTAVHQLRDSTEPKHGANNTGTAGTYGFVEHKPKPRFKVSVPYIPRNETVYPDRTHRGAPQTVNKASERYGGRPLPPSRLLSTVDGNYPTNTVDHETAARLYNGALV